MAKRDREANTPRVGVDDATKVDVATSSTDGASEPGVVASGTAGESATAVAPAEGKPFARFTWTENDAEQTSDNPHVAYGAVSRGVTVIDHANGGRVYDGTNPVAAKK
jgi:hypothetical protein